MYEKTKHHNLNKNQQAQAAATTQASNDGQPSHEELFMALMRNNYRQISEHKSASGFGGGGVPLTDQWKPPIMPVRGQKINFRQPFLNNESKSKQHQQLHLSDIYPHNAFSPLAHQLPPPQPLLNTGANNRGGPVPGPPMPQQQPLDLGTYREDSPIPLISSARLSTGEAQSKKTRPELQQQQHHHHHQQQQQQQQAPPPPPQIPMPTYPSLGPVGFPGAPLMSVAALIDAGYPTSGPAQVKPPSNPASAFSMGLVPSRHPSDTPPLLISSVPVTSNPIDRPKEISSRPMVIKCEPGVEVTYSAALSATCGTRSSHCRKSIPSSRCSTCRQTGRSQSQTRAYFDNTIQ